MKKATTVLVVLAFGVFAAHAASASNVVRISQVYGGGGNTGATYDRDYVELFNFSGAPVNIGGWSLQYGSATGTVNLGACTNCLAVIPQGATIPACGYYLIALAKGAVLTIPPLPVPPDLDVPLATAINMSATGGKIGLKADGVTTPCSPQTAFVDLVGYGTANCSEGLATGALSNSTMAVRNLGGLSDNNDNLNDFTVVTAAPRNSSSPINQGCIDIPNTTSGWGTIKGLFR